MAILAGTEEWYEAASEIAQQTTQCSNTKHNDHIIGVSQITKT
jgi:hypothetical protein